MSVPVPRLAIVRRGLAISLVLIAVGVAAVWAIGLRAPSYMQPQLGGSLEARRLNAGAISRSFLMYVPERLANPVPVMVVLHDAYGSAARMRSTTGWAFEEIADREGGVVVYPEGYDGEWNDCRAEGEFKARRKGVDDVAFIRAVVARLHGDPALKARQIAADEVFVAGFSNGGQMALRIALEAPDLVAGVAAIAATLPDESDSICTPSGRPVPVFLLSGDADPVTPYGGGSIRSFGRFNRRGAVQSAVGSAQYWSRLAGYVDPPFEHRYPDVHPADGTVATRMVWSAADKAEVNLVTIHGGGHTIPHPVKTMPRILGRTNHDVPAAEEIWRFFRRQLLNGRDPE